MQIQCVCVCELSDLDRIFGIFNMNQILCPLGMAGSMFYCGATPVPRDPIAGSIISLYHSVTVDGIGSVSGSYTGILIDTAH